MDTVYDNSIPDPLFVRHSKESLPAGITAGPDGNLWFTEYYGNKIGRITTSGTITGYALSSGTRPLGITVGPDDNIWFTDAVSNQIGKITP